MVDIPNDVDLVDYDGDDEENSEEDSEEDPKEALESNNGLVKMIENEAKTELQVAAGTNQEFDWHSAACQVQRCSMSSTVRLYGNKWEVGVAFKLTKNYPKSSMISGWRP
ncbi:hypothetical protein Tco_0524786 [Tanacetum coccineum]